MKIPYQQLSSDTLDALLEEVVSRNGTDYGSIETSIEQRKQQLLSALTSEKVAVYFDTETETVNILSPREIEEMKRQQAQADNAVQEPSFYAPEIDFDQSVDSDYES
ncbi:hypothetical protein SIN8267_00718 [Sinobacterium norvegicum]|uniref:YheU family protein n=1 Tax=Sinobacterium norvegicum TaxID=1641715 RepID=A0ABM9AD58_9GAMM|nr:YheU family protein [Sinobacterium norvegicum]CAH0990624.1 hypothetical protein SIN8267_00718 [Sinobacterium norvegicum]